MFVWASHAGNFTIDLHPQRQIILSSIAYPIAFSAIVDYIIEMSKQICKATLYTLFSLRAPLYACSTYRAISMQKRAFRTACADRRGVGQAIYRNCLRKTRRRIREKKKPSQ